MLNCVIRVALEGETAEVPGANPLIMIGLLLFFFVVWYFLAIRPQRKKDKELRAQLEKMRVGDSVITIGGLCGKVANINKTNDEVTIMTSAANTLVTFKRSAISTIVSRDAKPEEKSAPADKKGKVTLKKKEETAEEEAASTETTEEN